MNEVRETDIKELIISLTRLETKIDMLGNVREVAVEAQQSVKSAHLRLDRLDKIVFWLGTTVIGAVITGAIMALFKFAGK